MAVSSPSSIRIGDLSNLAGCILTDQLPFQRYLALYFCLIDLALLIQYLHYEGLSGKTHTHPSSTEGYARVLNTIEEPSVEEDTEVTTDAEFNSSRYSSLYDPSTPMRGSLVKYYTITSREQARQIRKMYLPLSLASCV
jgi:hypothetical protein